MSTKAGSNRKLKVVTLLKKFMLVLSSVHSWQVGVINIAKLRENLRKAHNVSGKEGDWNFGDNGICSAIAIQLEALQVTLHNKLVPTSSLLSLDFFPTSPPHLNCFRGFHMKSLFIQTPRAAEK